MNDFLAAVGATAITFAIILLFLAWLANRADKRAEKADRRIRSRYDKNRV